MVGKVEQANYYIDLIREKSNEAILFCSMGKDSLVLLDLMSKKFDKVVCVFMYFVKGLDHVERYIKWAESKYKNIVIEQVPHWSLTYILRSGMYCVRNPNVKLLKLSHIDMAMKLKYSIAYSFFGMKKADGMNRRLMLNTYTNAENNGKVYPLQDWTQKEILSYMRAHKLPEPVRYSKNASGGIGFNLDCFLWLRKKHSQDLVKIIKAFPMSERILFEYDNKK